MAGAPPLALMWPFQRSSCAQMSSSSPFRKVCKDLLGDSMLCAGILNSSTYGMVCLQRWLRETTDVQRYLASPGILGKFPLRPTQWPRCLYRSLQVRWSGKRSWEDTANLSLLPSLHPYTLEREIHRKKDISDLQFYTTLSFLRDMSEPQQYVCKPTICV